MKNNKNLKWSIWPSYSKKNFKDLKRTYNKNSLVAWGNSKELFKNSTVRKLEKKFSLFVNSRYAKGVGNATQGLHLALASLNIKLGDEVIVSVYSFISSASCILMQNATPVFVDIEKETLIPSLESIKKKVTSRTKALIITNLFGYAEDLSKIVKFCKNKKIFLIEDASHAHGSFFKTQHVGTFGDIGVFSFNERKVLPGGDGGMLVTNKKNIADKLYRLRSFGDNDLSYNYRLGELNAAIILSKLSNLKQEIGLRRKYSIKLSKILGKDCFLKVRLPKKNTSCSFYRLILEVNNDISKKNIIKFVKYMQRNKIPLNFTWKPLNMHSHFNNKLYLVNGIKKSFVLKNFKTKNTLNYKNQKYPVAKDLLERILELQIHPPLSDKNINYFKKIVKKFSLANNFNTNEQ